MNIKYNKIIERYKQYLISLSFDKVAWFGLNKYMGEYSFMSMDEDNVHIFKPKIFSRNNSTAIVSFGCSDDTAVILKLSSYTCQQLFDYIDNNLKEYRDLKKNLLKDKVDQL